MNNTQTKTKDLIGKGALTKCYLNEDQKTVTLITIDHIKECMSLGWFPESRLFPELISNDDDSFTMEYFPKVKSLYKSLNARDWKFYQILRKLSIPYPNRSYDIGPLWHEQFKTIPDEYEEERESLAEALDGCFNYGSDIGFEISPRNIATKDGKLILLDCFFVISQLKQVRDEQNKRRGM